MRDAGLKKKATCGIKMRDARYKKMRCEIKNARCEIKRNAGCEIKRNARCEIEFCEIPGHAISLVTLQQKH